MFFPPYDCHNKSYCWPMTVIVILLPHDCQGKSYCLMIVKMNHSAAFWSSGWVVLLSHNCQDVTMSAAPWLLGCVIQLVCDCQDKSFCFPMIDTKSFCCPMNVRSFCYPMTMRMSFCCLMIVRTGHSVIPWPWGCHSAALWLSGPVILLSHDHEDVILLPCGCQDQSFCYPMTMRMSFCILLPFWYQGKSFYCPIVVRTSHSVVPWLWGCQSACCPMTFWPSHSAALSLFGQLSHSTAP